MDAIDTILSRRSIRKYTAEPVPQDLVNLLLKAAMSAPSASNQQPWHFVVIEDRSILARVPEFHPYSAMLKQAPLAIAVCADLQVEINKGMWVQDCSAATQNILLAAHANALGAVWLGIYPMEERVVGLSQLLGLPEHIVPLSLVSIGYPAQKKSPENRFDLSRIHHNHW